MSTAEVRTLTASQIVAATRDGQVTVADVAEACLERIQEREPVVKAFAHLDPPLVRRRAAQLDHADHGLPLLGLPVAIKDLIDTADYPTELGSPIFAGRRPRKDAAVVDRLVEAGALVMGKTVTTEFALFQPGPTTNPWDAARTPGGSSSGSAAATADHMVAAALGTQTAGSVIRPASFCGIVGFKPSFGAIDRTGLKVISPSLDTLGIFARNVQDVALVFDAVRAHKPGETRPRPCRARRRVGLARTADWNLADPETRRGIEHLAEGLAGKGFDVVEKELPDVFADLLATQIAIMEREAAETLREELEEHPHLLSDSTRSLVKRGAHQPAVQYDDAQSSATRSRAMLDDVFEGLDGLLTPAVTGEAPEGLAFTGDPVFCRAWTLLHTPTVSLPLLTGPNGLPVGVQLVGRPRADDVLLGLASELMQASPSQ